MISVTNLQKSYRQATRRVDVLDDLNLEVTAGEFISITGESGAGKSTLLQVLGCLDVPSSGSYCLAGKEVAELTEFELAAVRNEHIGFIFQTSHFIDYLDLVDNVALHGFYAPDYDEDRCRQRATKLLTDVGLGHRLHHLPAELSGGERQRAAVARALFGEPALILADEPTGNLDRDNSMRMADLLTSLNLAGMTILLVTHDARLADIAGRQMHLAGGKLLDS